MLVIIFSKLIHNTKIELCNFNTDSIVKLQFLHL